VPKSWLVPSGSWRVILTCMVILGMGKAG
jgi:hypothetical protein